MNLRRPAQVYAMVEGLRQRHAELARPLTWHGIQRILTRECISIVRVPLQVPAQMLSAGGVSVIALNANAPARQHTGLLAHEWGHIVLHASQDDEVARQLSVCQKGDPRELEAKLFARLLLLGPHVGLEDPLVAPVAAQLERAGRQLPLPMALPAPVPVKRAPKKAPAPPPPAEDPRGESGLAYTLRRLDKFRKAKPLRRVDTNWRP